MLGAVDDFLAIVGPEGAAVVTQLASDGGLGVVAVRVGKLFQIAAIRLGRIDLIAIVNRPDVAMGVIRLRRTVGAFRVSRGEEDAIAGGKEIGASRAAFAGAYELGCGRLSVGHVHDYRVNLVARNAFALVLKNKIFVVEGEIGFGTLAAESKLPHVFQMLCLFRDSQRAGGCLRWRSWRNRVSTHPTAQRGGAGDKHE